MFCCLKKRHFLLILLLIIGLLCAPVYFVSAQVGAAIRPTSITDSVFVPILMYHSVLKDTARSGQYVLTPDELESDMLYLKEHGYTTIVMEDLIAYTHGGTLPEKPVMLTFDDGYLNNLTYVLPLLEKHDMRAVVSVVGKYADTFTKTPDPNPTYAHLTWEDIRALAESGYVEIQNHSYDMHRQDARVGTMQRKGESGDAYRQAILDDVGMMQTLLYEKCDIGATTFTYPFGRISKSTEPILRELGFTATLTCFERPNYVTQDPECLFGLNRYNRASGISTEQFMKKALKG